MFQHLSRLQCCAGNRSKLLNGHWQTVGIILMLFSLYDAKKLTFKRFESYDRIILIWAY